MGFISKLTGRLLGVSGAVIGSSLEPLGKDSSLNREESAIVGFIVGRVIGYFLPTVIPLGYVILSHSQSQSREIDRDVVERACE